ncbi:MAG: AHH domain-containing protein [Ruminococcus sp.]|nr:AHH domain-containing protein [Ruminococcus sp.]
MAAYVTDSELEKLAEPVKVYNLGVADFNTYFVGNEAVLVHNTCSEHSKKLRDNLASDGRPVGQGEAAAHIVASGSYKNQWENAANSRGILATYDIDIDDAANGIPLGHPNPHGQTHTKAFHDGVYNRLSGVVNSMEGEDFMSIRTALLDTLRAIGNQVLGGNYNI